MEDGAAGSTRLEAAVLRGMKKTVCVVGAGLAGGILGSTLAARGYAVTLLELGDTPAPLLPGNEVWERSEIKTPFTRGSGIGGTSNFWHGGLTLLDKTDLDGMPDQARRSRVPIRYGQLRDYYARAVDLVREGGPYSLDDLETTPDLRLDGFQSLGEAFRMKALLYPDRPFSTRRLIERAKEQQGLQVVPKFEVRRLVSSGRRFTFAEGVDVISGATRRIAADVFVLSAGGLGSPKILLQSAGACAPLARLPIGRYLIDHPTGFVFKAKLRRRMDLTPLFGISRRKYKLRYGFALNPGHLSGADCRNHILYLRPALSMKDPAVYDFLKRRLVTHRGRSLGARDLAYLVRHADLLFDAINFKYGLSYSPRYVSGLVFAEQSPDDGARMHQLANGTFAVNWSVSDRDCASVEKFLGKFFHNYSDLFESFAIFPEMSGRLDSAGHHSGACRMAAGADEGVVDADLRAFGTENLFVVDGSVLAYSGHANTGLTIAALALKCADALAKI
jgi:choline dehydrogenase-like flavoprotein